MISEAAMLPPAVLLPDRREIAKKDRACTPLGKRGGTAATQKNNGVLAMLAWDYFFVVPAVLDT